MKVVSYKICPFVQRVTALLEAKGAAYAVEHISLRDKPQWFLDLSPHAQVPVLITDDGAALFESDAIAEYLEEALPPLQPGLSPERRAKNRAWSYLASKNYLVQCGAMRSKDAETLAERTAKLGKAFAAIEIALGAHRFFGGDALGMVDIAWITLLHRAEIIERRAGYDFIGDRPRVKRWRDALMATGVPHRSVAPDFEAAFSAYYLSEETHLGRGDAATAA